MSNCTVKPIEDLSWRDVNDELVVLNLKTGEYYTFNNLGREIWLAIAEGKQPEQIIEDIAGNYSADRETVKSDIEDFLNGLLDKGVLVRDGKEG